MLKAQHFPHYVEYCLDHYFGSILTNNDGRWARYARKRTDLDVVDIVPGVVVVGNVEVVHIVIVVVVVVVVIVVVAVGIVHNIGSHRCSRPKKPTIKF